MSTRKKIKASYDNYALKWAERMRAGKNPAHDYLEKPLMYSRLADIKSKDVICVGCGSGEECNYMKLQGARHVVGIDFSEKLIRIARESYPECEFHCMDIEDLKIPDASYDFAYSSLVMHYLDDWEIALKQVYRILRTGGVFLFSTHHPMFNGMALLKDDQKKSRLYGFTVEKDNNIKVYGDYYAEILIDDAWFDGDFEISYYHRPFESLFGDIIRSGFKLTGFYEPKPQKTSYNVDRKFYEVHSRLPLFVIFELEKI